MARGGVVDLARAGSLKQESIRIAMRLSVVIVLFIATATHAATKAQSPLFASLNKASSVALVFHLRAEENVRQAGYLREKVQPVDLKSGGAFPASAIRCLAACRRAACQQDRLLSSARVEAAGKRMRRNAMMNGLILRV